MPPKLLPTMVQVWKAKKNIYDIQKSFKQIIMFPRPVFGEFNEYGNTL